MNLAREEKEIFLWKRVLTSKGEKKYKGKYYNKQSHKKHSIFRKIAYCPARKINCKCWACGKVGHYTNECKNKKNNKLIETFRSLDYLEISKEEALDLALKNNKRIVEVVIKDEYEESDYEETGYMIESSSISLEDLQGEEFTVDNENGDVKGDWVVLIIQKDMMHKNSSFS